MRNWLKKMPLKYGAKFKQELSASLKAISFLRTLLGSGKDACSTDATIPSGVRMSSTLMLLDELDDLARYCI